MKASILFSALTLLSTTFSLPTPTNDGAALLQVRDDTTSKANVFSVFEERQSCYETCGSVCYYQSTINNAVSDGYSRYQNGNTQGGYPHTYNNYEGFDFPVSGPYQEYPVMSSFKAYNGGSPGADRVIFNTQGAYAGAITHTGASGNNFVACDDGN